MRCGKIDQVLIIMCKYTILPYLVYSILVSYYLEHTTKIHIHSLHIIYKCYNMF